VQALSTGGFDAALVAYAVAAVTLVMLILGAAIGVSLSQEATVEQFSAATPSIKRWGGWVLIAVGTWFVLLSVFSGTFSDVLPV
jgi:cytochrome c biogenesis protein CcdA